MLDAVIIVLRETLEASLLVSFLFVYSNRFLLNKRWMFLALSFGVTLAFIVAYQLPDISDSFDGAGQEVLFILVLLSMSLLIQWINAIIILPEYLQVSPSTMKTLFSSILVLAISLEGAEIIVFFQSSLANKETYYSNLLGSLLGMGIGLSVGAVSYYLLSQSQKFGILICLFLLVFVSAGMASQAVSYLTQADFIESGYPVWDSSMLVEERSVVGQLLYALMGYEAKPTSAQITVYGGYLFMPLILFFISRKIRRRKK